MASFFSFVCQPLEELSRLYYMYDIYANLCYHGICVHGLSITGFTGSKHQALTEFWGHLQKFIHWSIESSSSVQFLITTQY